MSVIAVFPLKTGNSMFVGFLAGQQEKIFIRETGALVVKQFEQRQRLVRNPPIPAEAVVKFRQMDDLDSGLFEHVHELGLGNRHREIDFPQSHQPRVDGLSAGVIPAMNRQQIFAYLQGLSHRRTDGHFAVGFGKPFHGERQNPVQIYLRVLIVQQRQLEVAGRKFLENEGPA